MKCLCPVFRNYYHKLRQISHWLKYSNLFMWNNIFLPYIRQMERLIICDRHKKYIYKYIYDELSKNVDEIKMILSFGIQEYHQYRCLVKWRDDVCCASLQIQMSNSSDLDEKSELFNEIKIFTEKRRKNNLPTWQWNLQSLHCYLYIM